MLKVVQENPEFVLVPDTEPIVEDDLFDSFWILYPRHVSKKDARKAWFQVPDNLRVDVLVAVVEWRKIWLKRGEIEFIPYPSSWLRGERWEDELPPDARPSHASHVPHGTMPEPAARTEIPPHVLEQIARIKAGK
jgi:hypothetical protein